MNKNTHIAQFLKYLAVVKGCSPTTVKTYDCGLRSLEHFLLTQDKVIDWTLVDKDRIRLWIAATMERGVKPQSIKRALTSLRTFFRYLLMQGVVEKDPTQLIANPKTGRPLPVFVRQHDMDVLLDSVTFPDTFEGHRDHLILLSFYTTGMRISELIRLNVEDISFERHEVRVLGKRNKHRVIPFGDELSEALCAYVKERATICGNTTGACFITTKGTRMSDPQVRYVVKTYLSIVTTVKKRTPHVLRHTFATVMLNNGADLEAVKDLLGHDSVATTQIYTHTNFEEMKRAYKQAHPHSHVAIDRNDREP